MGFPDGADSNRLQCGKPRFDPWVGDPLEKEMETHSTILAWEISCTEEPGGHGLWGCKRTGHDLGTK